MIAENVYMNSTTLDNQGHVSSHPTYSDRVDYTEDKETTHGSSLDDVTVANRNLIGKYHVENGSHDPMEILLWSEQDDDVVDRLEHIPSFQKHKSSMSPSPEMYVNSIPCSLNFHTSMKSQAMDTISVPGHVASVSKDCCHSSSLKKSYSFDLPRPLVQTVHVPAVECVKTQEPLPRSMSTISKFSTFSQRFFHRWDSRFRRTMYLPGRRRNHDSQFVTSFSMAEDYLSLSIALFLLCVGINPFCLVLVVPSIILSSKVYSDQRRGKFRENDIRLHIVSLLHCITIIGGLIGTLLIVVIVTVVCLCT